MTTMAPHAAGEHPLEARLAARVELLRALERASEDLLGQVREGDPEELLGALRERQRVVDRLTACQREVEAMREAGDVVDPRALARIDRLEAMAARVLEQVRERDERLREVLRERRDALAGELAGVGRSRGAIAAYGAAGAGGARYQDREA